MSECCLLGMCERMLLARDVLANDVHKGLGANVVHKGCVSKCCSLGMCERMLFTRDV